MHKLILIETSTELCSTALSDGDRIICERLSTEPRAHAAMTAVFVKEMLDRAGWKVQDCSAVAVSSGPGSYTGLRVGSSTAKGLCFGAGLPLIAVSTPEVLFNQALEDGLLPQGCRHVIPMIDARRMEVYSAVFSPDGQMQGEICSRIVDRDSFRAELEDGPCLFIGDGADKCAETLACPNAFFNQCCPRASSMLGPALKAMEEKRFESTAYFEPFYLKDFIATVSRKKLF
ncbi:MAG: tRNA (adenosine(37)-N6)-threonylcarbamoyltransferase complex dimerization subunit type 1 TsaB [Bacteroidales bacterium]|nr:tRNA (adenosine(37)-N6)-threonylcarbamoyltransferase complex dimerization subunit type 1 TsaB [Bacteroidales bacterium]